MGQDYTGNPSNSPNVAGADRNAVQLHMPVGGDGFSVENVVNSVYRKVADLLTRVKQKGAFLDLTNAFTRRITITKDVADTNALQVVGGASMDTLTLSDTVSALKGFIADLAGSESYPGFFYKAATSSRATAAKWTMTSGMACRFIVVSTNKFIITINASWNGSGWVADTPNTPSLWLGLGPSGVEVKSYTAPNGSEFTDSAFTTGVSFSGTGTKGQVLAYTADGTAVFTNTARYGELFQNSPNTLGLQGIFAAAGYVGFHFYRDIAGYAGVGGTLTGVVMTGVSSGEVALNTLPSSPVNYRPSNNCGNMVMVEPSSGSPYFAKLNVYLDGNTTISGLSSSATSANIYFNGTRWRAV